MSIKKTVIVDVQSEGLETLDSQLNKVEGSLKDVKVEATNVDGSIEGVTKNGGAIAILDKLTGGMASSFRDAFEATKLFNFSLKGMRTALISTGIGALVVALGLVVAYWDDIVAYIEDANGKLEEQIKLYDEIAKTGDYKLSVLEQEKAYLISQGKSVDEVNAKLKKQALYNLNNNILKLNALKIQQQEAINDSLKLTFLEKSLNLLRMAQGQPIQFISKLSDDEKAAIEERTELIRTLSLSIGEQSQAIVDLDAPGTVVKPITPKGEEVNADGETFSEFSKRQEEIRKGIELENTERIRVAEQRVIDNEELQEWLDEQEEIETNAEDDRIQAAWEASKAIVEIEEIEKEQRLMLMDAVGAGLQQLSSIVGQETAAGKGMAAAGALISTYAAIAGQLKAFSGVPVPGFAIAQAIVTGLSGFAAVKNILSVKVPGSNGGGGVSGGANNIRQAAPSFNVVGTSNENVLAQTIAESSDKPTKAYVVSTEMSTQQEIDRKIQKDATFG